MTAAQRRVRAIDWRPYVEASWHGSMTCCVCGRKKPDGETPIGWSRRYLPKERRTEHVCGSCRKPPTRPGDPAAMATIVRELAAIGCSEKLPGGPECGTCLVCRARAALARPARRRKVTRVVHGRYDHREVPNPGCPICSRMNEARAVLAEPR